MDDEEEEEYEDEKAVLEHVFGPSSSSSSSSSSEDEQQEHQDCSREWEPIEQVKGLWICRDFLSPRHQALLLSAIEAQNWFAQPNTNQAMRFGDLPPWALHLSHSIRRSLLQPSPNFLPLPLPLHLLSREPFFDQMIANLYQPGEGICAHVDLLRFEDGIAIVSLESSCVMHFTPAVEDDAAGSGSGSVPVLLTPGSLVVMSGEARYRWKHEINRRPGFQVWEGKELDQSRRISVTLRKLCPNP